MRFTLKIIAMSVGISCLYSCNNERIKTELYELHQDKIHISYNSLEYVACSPFSDTLKKSIPQLRLIHFVDKNECSTCNIKQFSRWNGYIERMRQYSNDLDVEIIVACEPSHYERVKGEMKTSYLLCQAYIDTMEVFKNCNRHIPENSLLHTFLISQDGEVLVAGSPLLYPQIDSLITHIVTHLEDSIMNRKRRIAIRHRRWQTEVSISRYIAI